MKKTHSILALLCVFGIFTFSQAVHADDATTHNPAPHTTNLLLICPNHPLPKDYIPPNMEQIGAHRMLPCTHTAFLLMRAAMLEAGAGEIDLFSGYRSYEKQAQLFARKVEYLRLRGFCDRRAQELAAQIVQRAGASEHQSGMALDVSTTGELTKEFGQTAAGIWLSEHAHLYGFVIRYPRDKTGTTHITYEPWHLRYVGLPHSRILTENGLVLEEYAAFLAQNTPFIYYADLGEVYTVEIMCIPPEFECPSIVDISATHYGENARFIVTKKHLQPLAEGL